jgi:hypothetical protein
VRLGVCKVGGGHLGERALHGALSRRSLIDILLSLVFAVLRWVDPLFD